VIVEGRAVGTDSSFPPF